MLHLEKRGGTEARDGEGDAERSDSYGRREAARGARRERMTAAEGSSTRLLSLSEHGVCGVWCLLCCVPLSAGLNLIPARVTCSV